MVTDTLPLLVPRPLAPPQKGSNPLSGWKPSVPEGERLEVGTARYNELEALGLAEVSQCFRRGYAVCSRGSS